MKIAGLFAGIGGFELGMAQSGHETILLCDILPQSQAVLREQFPDVDYWADVTALQDLPEQVDCLTAGFPCQDLSQAGKTAGLGGARSGLIGDVFRLVGKKRVSTLVIENVPFMLQLAGGDAMRVIIETLESLGYRWAYRVVDTWGFGLPQRRERVFLVASTTVDPTAVLFSDENPLDRPKTQIGTLAHGFYWTEGLGGLGWAVDCVPTLKNGSTIGIASPPAILMPNGMIIKPSIEDAEALQGFPRGWTKPAELVARTGFRWGLVGSAVSVPVAAWLGERLSTPGTPDIEQPNFNLPFPRSGKCPTAARFDGKHRFSVQVSKDPLGRRPQQLTSFLSPPSQNQLLSYKATAGFYSRTQRAKLRFEPGFIDAVRKHLERVSSTTN